MSQSLAEQYDAIPFPNLPVGRSQPEFLETVARLRGLRPVPAAGARVLELGCAAGRNLLPLAERYPGASFLGLDLSARQIELAVALTRRISLTNVDFQQRDILTLDAQLGTFDYIIAHGVYSWVDAPVRDKLLAVCRELLAPEGVAYVSYKTYPGWKLHDMFRHMMQYDSRQVASPTEKLARARQFLQFVHESLTGDTPYETLARDDAALVLKQTDAYLWHDHLEAVSHPVYFEDFLAHARSHGLELLGDAGNGLRRVDYLGPELERQLAALTPDVMKREQFRDIIRNRGTRQTLLCHAGLAIEELPAAESLEGLYLEGALRPETGTIDLRSTAMERFTTASGLRIGTPQPLAKAALLHLGEAWPDFVRFEDLVAAACQRLEAAGAQAHFPTEEIQRLNANLLDCCLGHVVNVHAESPAFAARPGDRPAASPLARTLAETSDVVVSRRHDAVRLDPFDRQVLRHLDGTLDREQLAERLVEDTVQGRLVVLEKGQRLTSPQDARRALSVTLPDSLNRLARAALLIA